MWPGHYELSAFDDWPNFSGRLIISSVTTDGTVATLSYDPGDLAANTTYFMRIGALYNGATTYINTVPSSTSTLTSLNTTQQYYKMYITSVTFNWAAFCTGPGNNTSEGYELDASTMPDFSGTPFVTSVLSPATSTLTIVGLAPYTPYYFRVGGINYNNVVNYTVMAATRTLVGRAVAAGHYLAESTLHDHDRRTWAGGAGSRDRL